MPVRQDRAERDAADQSGNHRTTTSRFGWARVCRDGSHGHQAGDG
jgi:hypothetical protein